MSLQLHRPDGRGGLLPTAPETSHASDWRKSLISRRWRVARLRNAEMNPTSTAVSIAFWLALAGLTFGLLLWGYGSDFWH